MRVNTLYSSLRKTLRGDRRPPGVCTSFRPDAEYNGDNIAKIDFSCVKARNIRASLPLKQGKIMFLSADLEQSIQFIIFSHSLVFWL